MVEVVPSLESGLMAPCGRRFRRAGFGGWGGVRRGEGELGGVRTLAAASGGFLARGFLPWPAPSPGGYVCQLLETSNLPLLFMKL